MAAHRLELFSAGCPLCENFQAEIEIGKCRGCHLEVVPTDAPQARARMERYGIRVAPTVVIDGRIKVEGSLDEPWMCGDAFYRKLEQRFPLQPS